MSDDRVRIVGGIATKSTGHSARAERYYRRAAALIQRIKNGDDR